MPSATPSTRSDAASKAPIDIRHMSAPAIGRVANLSVVEFEADPMTFYNAARGFEMISKASRRLPDELVDRFPVVPRRSVRDAGNFYRDNYDRVLEEFV